jgi:CO/xanthine dehydrogenase FAD-binding subunit
MARLHEFLLHRPETFEEAARLLAAEPDACVIAGGTALLANLRLGLGRPASLV